MNKLAFPLLAFAAAACSGAVAPEPTSTTTAAVSAADVDGTWRFVLEASDVGRDVREECHGDAACWDRIAEQAKKEKIRFTRDASGAVTWTSFETDGKSETLYMQAPVELAPSGTHVVAKLVGAPKGWQAEKLAKSGVKMQAFDVEIVDAHTIAITDPKKGRLVYTKE